MRYRSTQPQSELLIELKREPDDISSPQSTGPYFGLHAIILYQRGEFKPSCGLSSYACLCAILWQKIVLGRHKQFKLTPLILKVF